MKQTLIEKIIANHCNQKDVIHGDIVDVFIDTRAALTLVALML